MLQLKVGLRNRKLLHIARDCALRPHHFDRRQSADFYLFLGVGECLLSECQRLLLDADVFIGVHQVPIDVFNLIDRGDYLQAKRDV